MSYKPATATTGFFQQRPKLKNQYTYDHSLHRVMGYYLPESIIKQATPELTSLGDVVISQQVFDWMADAETNLPYIEQQDLWGNPRNKLVTTEGWRKLKDLGVELGVVSTFYEDEYKEYSRIIGFVKQYLFSPSSSLVTCPFSMTDGCARVCQLMAPFEASGNEYFGHLVSRDPSYAWTSGQWMTERPGGSDVSNTETVAVPYFEKGPKQYKLSGFKWFSSATDSQVTITLARIGNDKRLSCFIVPVTEHVEKGNIILHRLKKKFGTVALPTAELELRDVQGELIGERGKGVNTISTVLNITRAYSSIGSTSFVRRAINIAREYSLVRQVFKRYLCDIPSHVRALATQETLARGMSFISFFAVELLGIQENSKENKYQKILGRIVPGVSKAFVCRQSVPSVSECMESLGGVGYMEFDIEFNIARLMRDTQVNSIWEGTTNVLSDDFIRFLMNNTSSVIDALGWVFDDRIGNINDEQYPENVPHAKPLSPLTTSGSVELSKSEILGALKQKTKEDMERWVTLVTGSGNLEVSSGLLSENAREYLTEFAQILTSILLISDASRTTNDKYQDDVSLDIATRWVLRDLSRSLFSRSSGSKYSNLYRHEDDVINKLIVYGTLEPRQSASVPKL